LLGGSINGKTVAQGKESLWCLALKFRLLTECRQKGRNDSVIETIKVQEIISALSSDPFEK